MSSSISHWIITGEKSLWGRSHFWMEESKITCLGSNALVIHLAAWVRTTFSGSFCPNLPADGPIIGHPSESAASNQLIASDHSQLVGGKGHGRCSGQDKSSSSEGSRVVGNEKLDRCCNLSNTTVERKRTIVAMDVWPEPETGRCSTASTEDTACSRPTGAACPQCQRICGYSDPCWLSITCDYCNLSAFRDDLECEFDIIVHHASGSGGDHSRGWKRRRILSY